MDDGATRRGAWAILLGLSCLWLAPAGARAGTPAAPCPPETVGSLGGRPIEMEIVNDLAFVANGFGGMSIIDISDPTRPEVLSTLTTKEFVWQVTVLDDTALLASGSEGLLLVDVSDPARVSVIGNVGVPFGEEVLAVTTDGDYAYLAVGATPDAIYVADITDPADASIVGSVELNGAPTDIEYANGYVYVSVPTTATFVFDVSDPTSPEFASVIRSGLSDVVNLSDRGFEITDDILYHAYSRLGDGSLETFDISDPLLPQPIGLLRFDEGAFNVGTDGSRAYVAMLHTGVRIVDVSEPSAMTELGSLTALAATNDAEPIGGDVAVAADGVSGLLFLDTSSPSAPVELSRLEFPRDSEDAALSGSLAYVVDISNGLRVLDVSNTALPVLLGSVQMEEAYGVDAYDGLVCVASGDSGLAIVDATTPTSPFLLAKLALSGESRGVALDAERALAFVACGDAGVHAVDLSAPNAPVLLATHDTPGTAEDVTIVEKRVYIADGAAGIRILDVSDPAAPSLIGARSPGGYFRAIEVRGTIAFAAAEDTLTLFDLTNTAFPGILSRTRDYSPRSGSLAVGVSVANNQTVYLADAYAGIHGFDYSDPLNLRLVYSVDTPFYASGLEFRDGLAFVAGSRAGLIVIDPLPCNDYDLDASGVVDAADLAILLAAWGTMGSPADIDGDGVVGAGDLAFLLAAWGL